MYLSFCLPPLSYPPLFNAITPPRTPFSSRSFFSYSNLRNLEKATLRFLTLTLLFAQGEEILTQTSIASSGNSQQNDDDDDDDDDEDDDDEAVGEDRGEDSEVEVEEQQVTNDDVRNQEDSTNAGGSYSEIF